VIIPCTDRWVRALAAIPQETFAGRFAWCLPTLSSVENLLDKGKFAELLEDLDLPRPWTLISADPALIDSIGAEWNGLFLKPRDSFAFARRFSVKGFQIESRSEARRLLHECHSAGLKMMAQEFIPGAPSAHHFLDGFMDRQGNITAIMARRRVRAVDGPLSDTGCTVTIDLSLMREPAAQLKRLLRSIDYRGLFSAEFKLDPRDNQFKFIEVNTRVWSNIALAFACGVDLMGMLHRDALGLEVVSAGPYRVGQHWVNIFRDCGAARKMVRARQLSWTSFARSWMGAVYDLFAVDDPGPFFCEVKRRLGLRLRRG
jgi:predicted ATP-grasp superfamily ATP-dependent carboligase